MNLTFFPDGWDDYQYWQSTDKSTLRKVNVLIKDCLRHPFEGIGKLEPLKNHLSGFWSRRIDREQRMVYRAEADTLEIAQCRYRY